jgi:hypothetical protein
VGCPEDMSEQIWHEAEKIIQGRSALIYEFSEEQIDIIKRLGMCSSLGAMLGPVVPRKGTELSVKAFAKEYELQARYCAHTFFNNVQWELLAEGWASEDIEIIRYALMTAETQEEKETILNKLFGW